MPADRGARKAPTNLSVRTDLMARARDLGINVSELLERALEEELRARERQAWLEQNERAFSEYAARVKDKGVFGDGRRRF